MPAPSRPPGTTGHNDISRLGVDLDCETIGVMGRIRLCKFCSTTSPQLSSIMTAQSNALAWS
ncbi:MAG TPA: hypothetical protein DDX19_23900 [Rhodopirellula baltica]|uniref:Uncharacterized protein n=1 Tax=Rhodopirellula baltica (strain DSM 10527 / NCIMB 13988 / SH1) TaxID=243090 RepID=Q7UN95_RHOBA|nr:hypothetical protein RB7711 [Rhodopirellula baltica SH 1]HBE65742.1 hypothetical protein [Rhodopirellula baltica]